MSNIEPTVTRTMRCPACSVVGVHTIDASMRNEAVLCPACAESGKRSACVAVEPTEEQKQAARDLYNNLLIDFNMGADIRPPEALARLLAEREAKLQERYDASVAYYKAQADAYHLDVKQLHAHLDTARAHERTFKADLDNALGINDTLRARVAELEAKIADAVFSCPGCGCHDFGFFASQIKAACGPCRTRAEAAEEREAQHLARIAELERLDLDRDRALYLAEGEYFAASAREAQHLADIKALREALVGFLIPVAHTFTFNPGERARDLLARLAHYDDAKADAPAVDWQAWANGSCPEPGCSLANPHEQGAACVKPTAEGGAR